VALVAAMGAALGVDANAIRLCGERGEAPYAMVDRADGVERIHLAISHDGAISVATWSRGAPVGIDVMAVGDFPDWRNVARDYLGPDTAAALAALPASAHAEAFARAWSEREARLKSHGLPMNEWGAAAEASLAACTCWALLLPAGYGGMLALARG
jgi:4'-phosphopantetheinyl transferase